MLPLLQTHQRVQPPLDPLAPFGNQPANGKQDYTFLYRHSRTYQPAHDGGSTPRSFAIRTAQQQHPSLHRISTTFTRSHAHDHHAEHSLRRKTPSGTIDNGYDGSHLVSGPPPLKQMALPASSEIFPTAVVDRSSGPSMSAYHRPIHTGSWPYATTRPLPKINPDMGALHTPPSANGGGWAMGFPNAAQATGSLAGMPRPQMIPQQSYQTAAGYHPYMGPGPQGMLNTPVFSPGGYEQAGSWREPSMAEYQASVPLANGYTTQNAVVDSAFMPTQSTTHHGFPNSGLGQAHPFRLPLSSLPIDDGFSRYGHNHPGYNPPLQSLQSLSLNSPASNFSRVANGEAGSPAQFKERALQHAHKAYNDLLAYLAHIKKAHHSRSGSGSKSLTKMVVYPKPPRTLATAESHIKAYQSYDDAPSTRSIVQAHQDSIREFMGLNPPGPRYHLAAGHAHDGALGHNPTIAAEIRGHPNPHLGLYHGKQYLSYPEVCLSPPMVAKASLATLSTLCEQSGWKWVDGMLLGGCLHYGLEQYEKALEWFRRIVSLDAGHVEAISNIAATLYCLGRQEEAEQHWVQAVKIRPSYLEAVEHLVGLLCSNHRNQQAVNMIEFVQHALKIPESPAPRDHASETGSEADTASTATARELSPNSFALETDLNDSPELRFSSAAYSKQAHGDPGHGNPGQQLGFGSSGYAIPGSENGRMILLIHAKGNMLYALKDTERASESFEEAVLISAGREIKGVQALIWTIQSVLAPRDPRSGLPRRGMHNFFAPLLLPPDKAKHTAQLVFSSSHGQLPGLQFVPDGSHRKSAVSTTSNSLLSLAKIFQDSMSNGGTTSGLIRRPTGVGDILALYYLSLSLQESPSTANNVGILLASVQQSATQQPSTPGSIVPTTIPGIVPGSGLALALAYYQYGLQLDQKHVHLHTNLGSLLKDIGQLDLAIQMYEKAVDCDGTFDIALTNLANAVKDRGRVSDAIHYYKRAVASNPDFAEAVCGLSTALSSVCDWKGRGGVLLSGGKYDRWHVDEEGMLRDVKTQGQGSGLMKRVVEIVGRQLRESSTWGCGVLQEHNVAQVLVAQLQDAGANFTDAGVDLQAELYKWRGRPWEGTRILRLIERSTRAAMRCWYQDKYVKGIQAPTAYRRPRPPGSLSIPSAPTVLPFHTFTCPLTAKDIRMISQRNALRISCSTLRSPWVPATVYEPPGPPEPYLRVGYVSSDFNNHPLAHLMQSVFGFHDQRRVKAFCYATTASDKSIHRQQIEREAPVFRDVSSWTSDRLVDQIVSDGIHILVNLNGYTRGARNEIFAARPAPIQMSFMGFAGTMGAEWCDYLLADSTAIPPSTLRPHRDNLSLGDVFRDEVDAEKDDWIYSENIIFCRDTFFCCDHAQSADGSDERDMSWEAEQRRRWKMRKELFPKLRDDVIILGNFNQLYKIDPTTFRTWLRILAAVPNAILWLLRFPELGETHLRRTAKDWAGEGVANRIIFTDVAPKQQHISRARVCDLFLDTPECNAHTTAADILWSSTPLLTLPRYEYKMCSRMAASILKGALPKGVEGEQAAAELIAADEAEYEETAIRLATTLSYNTSWGFGQGAGRLAELRKLLWKSKWSCALFDTRRWVRDLEVAYEEAWRRWVAGEGGDIYL